MDWQQIRIVARGEHADALSVQLEGMGASAVTLSPVCDGPDALFDEPGNPVGQVWDQVALTALFDATVAMPPMLAEIERLFVGRVQEVTCSLLPDQDWSRAWMAHFKPLCFAGRLWIVPAWLVPPEPLAINVLIEPGMAFGTGTHPTTALCLEWLAAHQSVQNSRVIDFGCGSGILAIAAAKLGAKKVHAVDLDPHALRATEANAAMNAVANCIDCVGPDALTAVVKADVLVANILLTPLCNLAVSLAQYVRPQGQLVLSGLLTEQLDACREVYSQWFNFIGSQEREGWGLLVGTRRSDEDWSTSTR